MRNSAYRHRATLQLKERAILRQKDSKIFTKWWWCPRTYMPHTTPKKIQASGQLVKIHKEAYLGGLRMACRGWGREESMGEAKDYDYGGGRGNVVLIWSCQGSAKKTILIIESDNFFDASYLALHKFSLSSPSSVWSVKTFSKSFPILNVWPGGQVEPGVSCSAEMHQVPALLNLFISHHYFSPEPQIVITIFHFNPK